MPARSKARKRAVDVIYEADQRGLIESIGEQDSSLEAVLRMRINLTPAQTEIPPYAIEIVRGVIEHLDRIDEVISTFAQGWSLARMPSVDRALLRVGSWEILYNEDVDDSVAIDEAVTLARKLSTDESPRFVNGLLARISQLGPSLVE